MNNEVQLFDFYKREELPSEFDPFRSTQVFCCDVCGGLTNNIEFRGGGKGGYKYPFPICPSRKSEWHKLLRQKIFLSNEPHPKSYQFELGAEIVELRKSAKNDIEGVDDATQPKHFPRKIIFVLDEGYD